MGGLQDLEAAVALDDRGITLSYWAGVAPDRLALSSPTGSHTFASLEARANQLVRALRRRGVGAGDSVVLLCSNRLEFAEVVVAADRAGVRLTPVNWHLTGPEVAYIVGDCAARALIADVAFASAAVEVAADVPVRLAVGGPIDGFEAYDAAVDGEDGSDIADPVKGTHMLYTSGTTGRPKGVHRDRAAPHTVSGVGVYGYRPATDAHLCTGPLYHAAPLGISLVVPLVCGTRVVLMDAWDPRLALELIETELITHTHMVPTMFHRLLALPVEVREAADVSSLKAIVHGAAPCPVEVKRRMIEWVGPIIHEYYAATESLGTLVDSHTWLAHPGTVGRSSVPGLVTVRDVNGEPVPAGEIGLMWFRAPTSGRFAYWGDADKTDRTYKGDNFTLGDMGYADEDGFLYLTDRSADLIISGGVNIYPAEVDAVLLMHPAVGDAGTIGIAHEEWGEEVLSVVEPAAGVEPSPELAAELVAWCRDRLAHFKCPRRVEFLAELPRSDAGKMQRRVLRERYRSTL